MSLPGWKIVILIRVNYRNDEAPNDFSFVIWSGTFQPSWQYYQQPLSTKYDKKKEREERMKSTFVQLLDLSHENFSVFGLLIQFQK